MAKKPNLLAKGTVHDTIMPGFIVFLLLLGSPIVRSFATSPSALLSRFGRLRLAHEMLHNDGDDEVETSASRTRKRKFFPDPFAYREELIVTIESLTHLGVGVARVPLPAVNNTELSWVVFVPLSLPGEKVRIAVFRNFATYSEADLVEVIAPSKDRVTPQCPYFAQCGGCQYQHMELSVQRAWKQAQVRDLLRRIGKLDVVVNTVVGTDESYAYRTKITPHYEPPRSDREITIGFQRRGTRQIVDVEMCAIASDAINAKYSEARAAMARVIPQPKQRGATLLFRECEEGVETDPRKVITHRYDRPHTPISPKTPVSPVSVFPIIYDIIAP